MTLLNDINVLSLEQALSAPYLTYRLVLDGMKVIRIEHPTIPDPNRYIGKKVLDEDGMNAYFLQYNVGKKSITLDLATVEGKKILEELIVKLDVDIFITNQLPHRYVKLGIDYERLKRIKENIIWVGISGYGPKLSIPTYDPIIQARTGIMDLTGEEGGRPLYIQIPIVDSLAAEHAYGAIMKALYKREKTGEGSKIEVSMFQSMTSWLITKLPLVKSFGHKISRVGSRHPIFTPTDVYPTKDGYIYIAVGSDRQWDNMTRLPGFESLRKDEYATNAGRLADVHNLSRKIAEITKTKTCDELVSLLNSAGIPNSKIYTLDELCEDPLITQYNIYSKDPRTGVTIYLTPPPGAYVEHVDLELSFPPRWGEHNEEIYGKVLGYNFDKIRELRQKGII